MKNTDVVYVEPSTDGKRWVPSPHQSGKWYRINSARVHEKHRRVK